MSSPGDQEYSDISSQQMDDQTEPDDYVEIRHMRETVHNMKLQDAIHRQTQRKIQRDNQRLEANSAKQLKSLAELEAQKGTDEQYLLKQQELIVKSEMAAELGDKVSEVETLKDRIKAQRAANRASQEFLADY